MFRNFAISKRMFFLLALTMGFTLVAGGVLALYMVKVEEESLVESERVLLGGI